MWRDNWNDFLFSSSKWPFYLENKNMIPLPPTQNKLKNKECPIPLWLNNPQSPYPKIKIKNPELNSRGDSELNPVRSPATPSRGPHGTRPSSEPLPSALSIYLSISHHIHYLLLQFQSFLHCFNFFIFIFFYF